jgi:hypothetical protein
MAADVKAFAAHLLYNDTKGMPVEFSMMKQNRAAPGLIG